MSVVQVRAADRFLQALRTHDLDYRAHPSEPNRWIAQCPAHEDTQPSLGIVETTVGTNQDPGILIHCWAGCPASDVVAALGLDIRDLFDDQDPTNRPNRSSWPRIGPAYAEVSRQFAYVSHLLAQERSVKAVQRGLEDLAFAANEAARQLDR